MILETTKMITYPNGVVCKSKNRKILAVEDPNSPNSIVIQVIRLLDKDDQEKIGKADKQELEYALKCVSKSEFIGNKIMFTQTRLTLDSAKLLVATLTTYINRYDNNRPTP